MRNWLLLSILFISFSACTKKANTDAFDTETWVADPDGCQLKRTEMVDQIYEVKREVLGLHQKSILKVFGKPDEEELYERSQTYFIYAIDPSGDCETSADDPRKLYIRFTALGIANEVNIK